MKNLVQCMVAGGFLLISANLLAQSPEPPASKEETAPTQSVDRGSQGAITMEEYQTLLNGYQETNPGKTFQNMSKEEFETYLTTELAKLRKKRAEEALKKETQQASEEPK